MFFDVYLSIYLFIYLYPSIYLSMNFYSVFGTWRSLWTRPLFLSIYLSISQSIYQSIHLSIYVFLFSIGNMTFPMNTTPVPSDEEPYPDAYTSLQVNSHRCLQSYRKRTDMFVDCSLFFTYIFSTYIIYDRIARVCEMYIWCL